MQALKTALALTIAFCVFGSSVYAADVAKIGVIDLQRILAASSYGKSAQEEVNKKGDELMGGLKAKEKELGELRNKIEREALVMSPEKREEKEREFRIKVNDLKVLEKKYKKELGELNLRLVSRIQNDIFILVEELGKKEGYLLVIEKREAGVVYAPNTIDISDRVVQLYNEKYTRDMSKSGVDSSP